MYHFTQNYMLLARAIAIVGLLASATHCQRGEQCPPVNGDPSCVCEHPDGKGRIDVSFLGLDGIDAPRFIDVEDTLGYLYSFNPCISYNEAFCSNVHICQKSEFNPDITYAIASAGTEQIYIDTDSDKTPYLFYTGPGGRTVYVYLHCTESHNVHITTTGDVPVFFEYNFHLSSCKVCPGGCKDIIHAGAVGIVVIVLLLVGIVVYFIMGGVVMKVKYNAAGIDLIPNRVFWKSIPGLIKDGALLTFSPCIKLVKKESPYSEVKT